MIELKNDEHLAREAFRISQEKGFWDVSKPYHMTSVLVLSEAFELFEAWRQGGLDDWCGKEIPKIGSSDREMTCAEEEAADVMIRVLDQQGGAGFRLTWKADYSLGASALVHTMAARFPRSNREFPGFLSLAARSVLAFCAHHSLDPDRIVRRKLAYNAGRPYMHGKRV